MERCLGNLLDPDLSQVKLTFLPTVESAIRLGPFNGAKPRLCVNSREEAAWMLLVVSGSSRQSQRSVSMETKTLEMRSGIGP
jgi:hypothetical protein